MHRMIEWFTRNEVAANLLMVLTLFLGVNSALKRIPLEVFPSFDPGIIAISMVYRGSTPIEVEEAVVVRIEEAIHDLQGIKQIRSVAREGGATVTVELENDAEPREMLDDIKNRVDAIPTFPEDTERPIYQIQRWEGEVISVVVSGDIPERELRNQGELIRDEIVLLPGITQVDLESVRPYEISIEVAEQSLDRYGLTFDSIVQAVRRSSIDLPAGSIKTETGEVLLRTKAQAYDKRDFENIVVLRRADGTQLRVGDVADVIDGFEENPVYSLFNGKPAVFVQVYRVGNQSAIEIGQTVRDYIEERRHRMPQGVDLSYWDDDSKIVKNRLGTLLKTAWQGAILIFVILTLFLRPSVALWVCAGIPVAFTGALALMPELGVTLNIMSLFAFILVLGIVVDDAIVTGENIYTYLKRGDDPTEAAIKGTQEISVPVTFGVLTTVVAFMPLLMVEGRRGDIWAQIPLIVIPVLLFSLIESKLILPAHMKHVRPGDVQRRGLGKLQQKVADGLEHFIDRIYRPTLEITLKHRYLTTASFIGVCFIIMSIVFSGRIGFTYFPRIESETLRVSLVMPEGTAAPVTIGHIKHMQQIAEMMRDEYVDPDSGQSIVEDIMAGVGWSHGGPVSSGMPNVGQLQIRLLPPEERGTKLRATEFVNEFRRRVGQIPGAKELNYRAEIGRYGDPIDIQLEGLDFDVLTNVADKIKARLASYSGIFDVNDSFQEGKPELKLKLKPEAELLGVSTQDLGRQVRDAFFGAEAQRIQRGREDVRVMVRYPSDERHSAASLQSMRIRLPNGAQVPFSSVADIKTGLGYASIDRVDRQRILNVRADLDKDLGNIGEIVTDLTAYLDRLVSEYPRVNYSVQGELREQQEANESTKFGVIFILFAIYAMLAIPFRSYVQPLIVMSVIPFSVVGAVAGHMIMGLNLSMMSLFGMLALGGVVVNDSLVLVDWINRRVREGMPIHEAVRKGGVARFRPILLTSLTTFGGLGPLMLEKSTQAQFLIPMAVSLGWGILFATFLTLLLIPSIYLMLEDLKCVFADKQDKSDLDKTSIAVR
jgi:multidrug efflux pump subunit AcrB